MPVTPYIGEIILFGGNFQIRGFAFCNGQIMSIAQNTALFSLLGTTYGGNGQTTFHLPDLRGRMPVHMGTGPGGLTPRTIGEAGGIENVTILATQMPAHNHLLNATSAVANTTAPANNYWAAQPALLQYAAASTPASNMKSTATGLSGGNLPHSNIKPYLAVNYLIALEGIFPSRN